ncbi:MAG: hypothetical protein ABFR63_07990 [Thermodesulfobacteriota bacterium]
MTKTEKSALGDRVLIILYLMVILTTLLIALIGTRNEPFGYFLISESGPLQNFTVVGYFIAFLTALVLQWNKRISLGYSPAIILLVMGLRELDFHSRFTTMGIMKSRFYISEAVPLQEKIIGGAILLAVAVIVAAFFLRHYRSFWQALKEKSRPALLTLSGISFAVISKIIDSTSLLIGEALEESMETAIPYLFLAAMLLYVRQEKRNSRSTEEGLT